MDVFLTASGSYLPDRIVANEEISDSLGVDPEKIFKSSGIRKRHWASVEDTTSALASRALSFALRDADLSRDDIDYLILGTMTADRFIPGSASAIQKNLGLREIPCLDIRAACCNMLYGMQLGSALIKGGTAKNVAICLADIQSPWLDLSPKSGNISMLMGDAGSAIILSNENRDKSVKLLDIRISTDGTFLDDLGIRSPGTEFGGMTNCNDLGELDNYFGRMNGLSVISNAISKMTDICEIILRENGLTITDVRWLVPHQANINILDRVASRLNFRSENGGLVSILENTGNTSSASMGLALDALRQSDRININDYILMPGFAAGFTWGAGLGQVV